MIDVVVINWNSGRQLQECIASVLDFGSELLGQIVVVDNASTDDSEVCAGLCPSVALLRLEGNQGFGTACNIGASQCKSAYILFLNPDARLFAGTLRGAYSYMQARANASVGICGVQLMDDTGRIARSCSRFPSASLLLAHVVGLSRVFSGVGHQMLEWDHCRSRSVDHVIGAFYMVRREVFEALQGFDEQFFLYLEDLDFSLRAHRAGWQSIYLADVQAFHAGGGTSRQIKARRLFYSLRSRMLYAFKHFSLPGALLVCSATLLVEPFTRSALAVCTGSLAGLRETWSAYLMLWRWLPHWIFKGETR